MTNSVSGQQVCVVSFDSSTLGKELYCHVRLRVEKPSGSLGFVVMVLLFDGHELVFGSSLADQGILWDSERSDCLFSHPDEADIM